jgi:hypothetical protein
MKYNFLAAFIPHFSPSDPFPDKTVAKIPFSHISKGNSSILAV